MSYNYGHPQGNGYGAPAQYAGAHYPVWSHDHHEAAPAVEKKLQRKSRRRLNAVPMCLCLLLPWILFSVTYGILSSHLRQDQPILCVFIAFLGFMTIMMSGCCACESRLGSSSSGGEASRLGGSQPTGREPSWFTFLFWSSLLAWFLAMVLSGITFHYHTAPGRVVQNLNTYSYVDPAWMKGAQVMDAGVVSFVQGTRLDFGKSMGFKHNKMYCVVPITHGNDTLYSYDFWAVGTNCCSGQATDFHCKGFNKVNADAVRLLSDDARPFYRLAVQQAEAAYGIKAVHPIFFEWGADVPGASYGGIGKGAENTADRINALSEYFKRITAKYIMFFIIAYFIFQAFLVACASLVFSKFA